MIARNGQKSDENPDLGLFGGTEVYSERRILWFLDDKRILVDSNTLILASTCRAPFDIIELNLTTGELKQVNMGRTSSVGRICSGEADVIEWFHEYGKKLESGFFQSFPLFSGNDVLRVRSKFPQSPPYMSTAITRGIKITMSKTRRYKAAQQVPAFWQYEITIRLLSSGEPGYVSPKERGFDSAQLLSRYWELEMTDGTTQVVDDFGVVGLYPLIRDRSFSGNKIGSHYICRGHLGKRKEEEGVFRYCSIVYDDVKFFGGHLCFVPGSIDIPTGPRFQATVARNEMVSPDMTW